MNLIKAIYSVTPDITFQILDIGHVTWRTLFYSYPNDIMIWLYDSDTKAEGGFLVHKDGSNIDLDTRVLDQLYNITTTEKPANIVKSKFIEFKSVTGKCFWYDPPLTRHQAMIPCPEHPDTLVPLRMTYQYDPIANDIMVRCPHRCTNGLLIIDGLVVPYKVFEDAVRVYNIRHWVLSNVINCIGRLELPCSYISDPLEIDTVTSISADYLEVKLTETVPLDNNLLMFVCGNFIDPKRITILNDIIRVPWEDISLDKYRDVLGPMMFEDYEETWYREDYRQKVIDLGYTQVFNLPVLSYQVFTQPTVSLKPKYYKRYIPNHTMPLIDEYGLFVCYKEVMSCEPSISCVTPPPLKWLNASMIAKPLD